MLRKTFSQHLTCRRSLSPFFLSMYTPHTAGWLLKHFVCSRSGCGLRLDPPSFLVPMLMAISWTLSFPEEYTQISAWLSPQIGQGAMLFNANLVESAGA